MPDNNKLIESVFEKGTLTIRLFGRIDSTNAAAAEEEILAAAQEHAGSPVVLDMEKLAYISSAGLRVLLHLKKLQDNTKVVQVSPEIYEILDMTGFTQILTVEKAWKKVSIEGCEVIGVGAKGTIYRIDQDNVVKVYNDNDEDVLEEISKERENAKLALILGIPTAISYDVVKVGDSYGSVFELLDAKSFSKIIEEEPEKIDWCVKEYTDMLKKIHETEVPEGKLTDMRDTVTGWAEFLQDYLPKEAGEKLLSLVKAVPADNHMLHGDYHTKNLELMNGEVLLIDMDTLAVGSPVFDLAFMFNAYQGFSELDHENVLRFQGFDFETAAAFWHKVLAAYLGTEDEEVIWKTEDKARIVGYSRLIRRAIRRKQGETEEGRKAIDWWTSELLELLERTDSLT